MKAEEFIPQYEAALASQDWSQVSPLIHKEAIVTFSDGSIHEGIDKIQIAFERNFKLIKSEKYEVLNVEWVEKEESNAQYNFHFKWEGYINGELMGGSGKGSCQLIKDKGNWLLWREELSR